MSNFVLTDCTKQERYALLKKCVQELQKRVIVKLPNSKISKRSKNGIQDLQLITAKNLTVERAART